MKRLTVCVCIFLMAVVAMKADITFSLAGDIMMGTTYPEVQLPTADGKELFKDVASVLRGSDVTVANLEGVMLDGKGEPKRCGDPSKCFVFKMPEKYVSNLTAVGIDFVSMANNHVNDFGNTGRNSTMRVLKKAGIAHAGLREECPTAIIERAGKKIGFTAFDHARGTLSVLNVDEAKRIVSELKKKCDIVVVSMHGGAEGAKYTHVPHQMEMFYDERRGDVEQFAHAVIDAGADIVYGHGPHVTRAVELYKDRFIIYSLGNFVTPYGMNLNGPNSHAPVVTLTIDDSGRFKNGKIHSFKQTRGVGPRADTTNSVAANIRSLTAADFPATPLVIAPDGTMTRKHPL